MSRLFIGIGSNVGDRQANIIGAVRRIAVLPHLTVQSSSSIYETEPVGGPPQGRYLNCVLEALSKTAPRRLLGELKGIEKEMGRRKSVRHGPRVIDLDILLCGDIVLDEDVLKIPHAELHKRAFVLIPLLEIDENLVHPTLHQPLKQLLADCSTRPAVKPFAPPPCL